MFVMIELPYRIVIISKAWFSLSPLMEFVTMSDKEGLFGI